MKQTAPPNNPVVPTIPAPEWQRELHAKYIDGMHAFVLAGNVIDEVGLNITLEKYLFRQMSQWRPAAGIIASYNRATGFTFAMPSMREKFMELAGLSSQEPVDPSFAAMAQAAGLPTAPAGDIPTAPAQAMQLINKLLHQEERDERDPYVVCHFIITAAETLFPDADPASMSPEDRTNIVYAQQWGPSQTISRGASTITLVTPSATLLHVSLRAASSRWEPINVPTPDEPTRLAYINAYAVAAKMQDMPWTITPEELARATAGLCFVHLKDILARAKRTGTIDRNMVLERKNKIIEMEFGGIIKIQETSMTFADIGGMAVFKRYLRRNVIEPLRTGNSALCPMGLLLAGPAGTGKTILAKALAAEASLPFIILDPGQLMGKYVGQSEEQTRKALAAIEANEPCIVFCDEIDQAIQGRGGSSGDGGVSDRIFKALLEFLADKRHKGKIVFLAATNRPDLMDAAFKRPGRVDKVALFPPPDDQDRMEILNVNARRGGLRFTPIAELTHPLVIATKGWTGAEIDNLITKANELVAHEGMTPNEAILAASERLIPTTQSIDFMIDKALEIANDADLIPTEFFNRWKAIRTGAKKPARNPDAAYEAGDMPVAQRG
jgi:transitional endoplasmic reticulum ATPase